jgi:hypothetical protein
MTKKKKLWSDIKGAIQLKENGDKVWNSREFVSQECNKTDNEKKARQRERCT